MLHPLTLSRLEDALAQPGCPVCWEVECSSRRYLRRLLREDKGSEAVWQHLRQSWGLCRAHTRGLLSEETRTIPGFSTATLYRWLSGALLDEAGRGDPGARQLSRRRFRNLLEPRGSCLACEQLSDYERAVMGSLVRALASGEPPNVREAYVRGDGFCLPHLRMALDLAGSARAAEFLVEHFIGRLKSLIDRLVSFLEAHTTSGVARTRVDSGLWIQAAERFAERVCQEPVTPAGDFHPGRN